ncbi:CD276 antigen-like [Arapaima gigas]
MIVDLEQVKGCEDLSLVAAPVCGLCEDLGGHWGNRAAEEVSRQVPPLKVLGKFPHYYELAKRCFFCAPRLPSRGDRQLERAERTKRSGFFACFLLSVGETARRGFQSQRRLPHPTPTMDDIFISMKMILQLSCVWTTCAGNIRPGAFEVTAPQRTVTAVHGRPVMLGCRYTVTPHTVLGDLFITWQTLDKSQVLHSFYYEQDQLKQQSNKFWNRTSLFVGELLAGNASLRLADVRPSDAGSYQCTVSSQEGTDKAEVHLKYAAFYSEPRLNIHVWPNGVTLQYQSEGFPEPEVHWRGSAGHSLSHESEVLPQDGLLVLRSRLVLVNTSLAVNVTFTLRNQALDQLLERTVSFQRDHLEGCARHLENPTPRLVILLLIFSLLLVTFVMLWRKLTADERVAGSQR